MPYIHNFKEQTHLTANCFNKINFQTISSITIDFYIVSFIKIITPNHYDNIWNQQLRMKSDESLIIQQFEGYAFIDKVF